MITHLVRIHGFEPWLSGSRPDVLPLHYILLVRKGGAFALLRGSGCVGHCRYLRSPSRDKSKPFDPSVESVFDAPGCAIATFAHCGAVVRGASGDAGAIPFPTVRRKAGTNSGLHRILLWFVNHYYSKLGDICLLGSCGQDANRTRHSDIASIRRQPWNMLALVPRDGFEPSSPG